MTRLQSLFYLKFHLKIDFLMILSLLDFFLFLDEFSALLSFSQILFFHIQFFLFIRVLFLIILYLTQKLKFFTVFIQIHLEEKGSQPKILHIHESISDFSLFQNLSFWTLSTSRIIWAACFRHSIFFSSSTISSVLKASFCRSFLTLFKEWTKLIKFPNFPQFKGFYDFIRLKQGINFLMILRRLPFWSISSYNLQNKFISIPQNSFTLFSWSDYPFSILSYLERNKEKGKHRTRDFYD